MGNIARKQKLTGKTIRAIMQRTKFDEVTVLEMHDQFYRLNPSGKMKLVKMFHIYEEFFPTNKPYDKVLGASHCSACKEV